MPLGHESVAAEAHTGISVRKIMQMCESKNSSSPKLNGVLSVKQLPVEATPVEPRYLNQRIDTPPSKGRWVVPLGESIRDYTWMKLPECVQRRHDTEEKKPKFMFAWVRKETPIEVLRQFAIEWSQRKRKSGRC